MSAAYADTRFRTMQAVTSTEGIKALCYDQQAALVESLIEPGMTVLDVGCGPSLPYDSSKAWVIGLDPSAESLAANTDVDERIVGTASDIPLPDASVDLIVAFYSLHHIPDDELDRFARNGARVLGLFAREMFFRQAGRVLKPGGDLLVFEMTPWRSAWWAERLLWGTAKRLLGDRLDAYFWPDFAYENVHRWHLPTLRMSRRTFHCSPFATFAPIFTLPWLKVSRLLYPFDAVLYRWTKESPHG
jgi:SAM-dependent methyltransferase